MVIDADLLVDGAEIDLAGLGVGGGELVLQESGEGVDAIRREGLRGPRLLGNALEGGLGKVAGGLEGGDAILQLVIEIDYPLLDGAVEPGELDRKSTRLNSSHSQQSRMPSSA